MATGWMSDVEALMWHVQRDPFLDPTFGSLTVLESLPDVEHLRARLAGVASRHPRFGQRVMEPAGRLTPPVWCDTEVDLDHHVRVVRAEAPGTRRELLDLAARWVQEPLDPSLPLWQFAVVEGLADGVGAVIQKVHHTVVDGEGGLRVSAELLDLGPDMPSVDPAPRRRIASHPTGPALVATAAAHLLQRTVGSVRRAAEGTVGLATHPEQVPAAVGATVTTARAVLDQLTVADGARSPLWATRTLRRRLDTIDLPLEELRTVAHRLGGSVNDAFVTVLTGAIGHLHDDAGLPTDVLRMAMPVSTRRPGVHGGNAFVPTRLLVPIAEVDPRRRFAAVHDVLAVAKHDPVLGVVEPVAALANLLPTTLSARIVRDQARAVDFAASNVRGAGVPLWLAGAKVQADYPIGPLTAAALNVSLLSLDGTCHLGLHSDAGAVREPDRLRELVATAHAELVDATR
jgi:diacylglycerol O-acyltransferase